MLARTTVILLAIATTLASSESARAQGFIIPDLGSRLNGMGAAIGRPDDVTAIYHNPAALALLPGTQFGVSYGNTILNIDVSLKSWDQGKTLISDPVDAQGYYAKQTPTVYAPLPFLGVSTKLGTEKVTGAIGIYVPNAAGASFGETSPSRYHIIDAFVFSAFFTAAVGWRPLPWLAVGLGASAVYVNVHRRQILYPFLKAADPSQKDQDLTAMIGKSTELEFQGSDVRPAFSLGIQVWPHRTVSLGFMMLSRYDIALTGPLALKPGPDALPAFQSPAFTQNEQRTTVVSPWIFGWGVNWDITPWLELGAEFRFYLNSEVDKQVTSITNKGVLQDLIPNGIIAPKNYHNSIHTGGGFRVKPPIRKVELDLFTGMHYLNSPSPDNSFDVSTPNFDTFVYHVGARWQAHPRFRLGLFYGHYWYLDRQTTDSITYPPTNFSGRGSANIITLVLEGNLERGIGVRSAPASSH